MHSFIHLLKVHSRFRKTCRLHLQGWMRHVPTQHYIPEDRSISTCITITLYILLWLGICKSIVLKLSILVIALLLHFQEVSGSAILIEFVMVFLGTPRQMPGLYLKSRHNCFLPYSFQFILSFTAT
jgi:hypothetical protein